MASFGNYCINILLCLLALVALILVLFQNLSFLKNKRFYGPLQSTTQFAEIILIKIANTLNETVV